MGAREVITQELHRLDSFLPKDDADNIIYSLRIAGFVAAMDRQADHQNWFGWTEVDRRALEGGGE